MGFFMDVHIPPPLYFLGVFGKDNCPKKKRGEIESPFWWMESKSEKYKLNATLTTGPLHEHQGCKEPEDRR